MILCFDLNKSPGDCRQGLTIEWTSLMIRKESAAKNAEPGIVSSQAQTIRLATRHLTAESRTVDPTPVIAPVIVWVVDTGIPNDVAPKRVIAPAVSAQNPPTGRNLVILDPIV